MIYDLLISFVLSNKCFTFIFFDNVKYTLMHDVLLKKLFGKLKYANKLYTHKICFLSLNKLVT